MLLRGNKFPNVWCASGARGFFKERYKYHFLAILLGMTWKRTAFVSKTTTLSYNKGNMPLARNRISPKQLHPKCIKVYPWYAHTLNAVGLSGPGAEYLFKTRRWDKIKEPFMISFMTIADTKEERLNEFRHFCRLMKRYMSRFEAYPNRIAVQLNFACPNTGHDLHKRYAELKEMLDIAADLGIPVVVNFNPLVPVNVIMVCQEHPACDAVWIANTIMWESPGSEAINWALFKDSGHIPGNLTSPLTARGFKQPGGLSGPQCLPFTIKKVGEARDAGFTKPIIAGNGVQRREDVIALREAGASGVALGIVGMVRPWRMRGIIKEAHWQFDEAA